MNLPSFFRSPTSAVSGRMLHMVETVDGMRPYPALLEIHLLPAVIGSSVYVLDAVGPSIGSWPFFPGGGFTVVDHDRIQLLSVADDAQYVFELGGAPIELDLDLNEVWDPIDLVPVALSAEALQLHPWDEAPVAEVLDECFGAEGFDEFMAIPAQDFDLAEGGI